MLRTVCKSTCWTEKMLQLCTNMTMETPKISGNMDLLWVGSLSSVEYYCDSSTLCKKYMTQPVSAFCTNCYCSRHLWTKIILNLSSIHLQIRLLLHQARFLNQFMYYANRGAETLQFWPSSNSLRRKTVEMCLQRWSKRTQKPQTGVVVSQRMRKRWCFVKWENHRNCGKNWNVWSRLI